MPSFLSIDQFELEGESLHNLTVYQLSTKRRNNRQKKKNKKKAEIVVYDSESEGKSGNNRQKKKNTDFGLLIKTTKKNEKG